MVTDRQNGGDSADDRGPKVYECEVCGEATYKKGECHNCGAGPFEDSASSYRSETSGVIDTVEVTITVTGDDEHLADLIHSDLTARADELNQIVELGRHPAATSPPSRVDWEGWLHGDYDDVVRGESDD